MKHAIIVHGFKSRPDTNWKPWLAKELEQEGFAVDIPEMPDTTKPVASAWNKRLSDAVGTPSDVTYLIGHSLGCITILRYLETLNDDHKIGACVLVAGFGERFQRYDGGHDTFFDHELNWMKIRQHCDRFIVIHSDDDPNVEIEQLELLTEKLNAKAIRLHGMGHFGSDDGVYELPVVRDELLGVVKQ